MASILVLSLIMIVLSGLYSLSMKSRRREYYSAKFNEKYIPGYNHLSLRPPSTHYPKYYQSNHYHIPPIENISVSENIIGDNDYTTTNVHVGDYTTSAKGSYILNNYENVNYNILKVIIFSVLLSILLYLPIWGIRDNSIDKSTLEKKELEKKILICNQIISDISALKDTSYQKNDSVFVNKVNLIIEQLKDQTVEFKMIPPR